MNTREIIRAYESVFFAKCEGLRGVPITYDGGGESPHWRQFTANVVVSQNSPPGTLARGLTESAEAVAACFDCHLLRGEYSPHELENWKDLAESDYPRKLPPLSDFKKPRLICTGETLFWLAAQLVQPVPPSTVYILAAQMMLVESD